MHEKFMKRALALAEKGIGYVNPNPLVGAVIVKNERIIGEGFHTKYGEAHAEIHAFQNAVEDVQGSAMYVTLEPCSHYGKTPPCVDAIIAKKVAKVIIGMKDPNPMVAGRGIEKLKNNGIEVIVGVLEEECKRINEIFIKYITTKTPFCIMKTAMTLDGKIATKSGDSKWISNELSREYVHQIRHRVSAIMVGVETVLRDNPILTTRLKDRQGVNPIRIVVDSKARTPVNSQILNSHTAAKTIIATTDRADLDKIEAFKRKQAEVWVLPTKDGRVDLQCLMKKMGEVGIDSVLLEGGGTLNYSALQTGIIDKVLSFISPKIIGGYEAKTPVEGEGKEYIQDAFLLECKRIQTFGEDIMIEAYLRKEAEGTCLQD